MSDDEKKKRSGKVFRIYPFLDLRILRRLYLKNTKGLAELDSADNPSPDAVEEDFGLTRSSADDALKFFRQSTTAQDGDDTDDLAEFLNDS